MQCAHCGAKDSEDFVLCSECGRPRSLGPHPGDRAAVGGVPVPLVPAEAGPGSDRGPPADEPKARLVAFGGPLEGQEFVLDRAETGIGRRPGCDIVVPDQSVSRLHARIRAVPDGYLIEDAGSANGTWVNEVRLDGAQLLVESDVIRIGAAAFTFRSGVQAATAPSGPVTVVSSVG